MHDRPGPDVLKPAGDSSASVLASYVPADAVLNAAVAMQAPTEPKRETFDCAVAFVDISGFTALSERLKKESGKAGSELLSVYVNAYLERLIQAVSLYYGDVIKFAGDALQVVWRDLPIKSDDGDGPLSSAALARQLQAERGEAAGAGICGGSTQQALASAPALSRHVMQASRCCLYLLNNLNNFCPVEGTREGPTPSLPNAKVLSPAAP